MFSTKYSHSVGTLWTYNLLATRGFAVESYFMFVAPRDVRTLLVRMRSLRCSVSHSLAYVSLCSHFLLGCRSMEA